jgi:hypothetical protein
LTLFAWSQPLISLGIFHGMSFEQEGHDDWKIMKTLLICVVVAVVLVVIALVGCADLLYSDSANAGRRHARATREALDSARLASSQTASAQPVAGDALVALLAGNTLVSEYRKRSEDARPYFTVYEYYAADGTRIVRDTYSRRTEGYEERGRWSVDAELLCLREDREGAEARCFTVRLTTRNTIEFWTHKPGDPFHGLLSSRVEIVRPGPQTPEYITTTSPYQR